MGSLSTRGDGMERNAAGIIDFFLSHRDLDGFYYNKANARFMLKDLGKSNGDTTRVEKAKFQSVLDPVPHSKVYAYVNEFLELVRDSNGFAEKNIRVDSIQLPHTDDNGEVVDGVAGKEHLILDNGIIIHDEKNWIAPRWNGHGYDIYDPKYDKIAEKFALERVSDILWLKFTKKGHVAVVAKSCDINWDYTFIDAKGKKRDVASGKLVHEVGEELDDTFVFVFPLTRDMIRTKEKLESKVYTYRTYDTGELERGVGNYLISKGVPIIDYFSHMN